MPFCYLLWTVAFIHEAAKKIECESVVNQARVYFVTVFTQVQKHLSKLFDNMAKMQFEGDEERNPSKAAVGMYSKEDEYVPFNQPCDCSGQVK